MLENLHRIMDNTKELSKIIDKDKDVEKVTKKFLKRLDGYVKRML